MDSYISQFYKCSYCYFALVLTATAIAAAQVPVSDPTLAANAVPVCMRERQEALKDLCSPEAGGPKGGSCLSAARMCQNIQPTGGVTFPKYVIISVIYAPPGCGATATFKCGAQSQVQYLTQSSSGTKISLSSSIKTGVTESVDAGISLPGFGS
jgi:hypothetical protein